MKMKYIHNTFIIILLTSVLCSCSSDDDTQAVTPPVSDNEAPVLTAQTFNTKEDIDDNTVIGTVSATDAEDDELTFTLTQNSDELFEITKTGDLSLATGKGLDFEKVTSHEITVEVSDGTNTANATVTIMVENVFEPFITTWKTTTANEFIEIVVNNDFFDKYDYTIDWGDGTVEQIQAKIAAHEYANPGTHTVEISGVFPAIRIAFIGLVDTKILSIEQWGDIEWESFELAFAGCENLEYNAKDTPNLTNVTDMSSMFSGCEKFTAPNLNNWDVSTIEDMSGAFGSTAFNGDVSQWNVSNVTNMSGLFFGTPFNGDISQWDVSNVTDMSAMFRGASSFNGDIGKWNVGKVENMAGMFFFSEKFNQDLNDWNVGNVKFMANMFIGAASFEGNVSNWNVSNVTNMDNMFTGATSFNADLSQWDVSNVKQMKSMLDNTNMSFVNYDKLLISWAELSLQPNVIFGAQGLVYCNGKAARTEIVNTNSWNIQGDREECLGL